MRNLTGAGGELPLRGDERENILTARYENDGPSSKTDGDDCRHYNWLICEEMLNDGVYLWEPIMGPPHFTVEIWVTLTESTQ